MKIIISKIDAARSQLIEAIRLFFEQRDPVSMHALACAALQILHDHIPDVETVFDENLVFHYHSIYIKDEYRKEWKEKISEARNFFKHADQDLKRGRNAIEFETTATQFYIFEAIRCLRIVEKETFVFNFEFRTFIGWYGLKYPQHFKPEGRETFQGLRSLDPDNLNDFNKLLVFGRENPRLVEDILVNQKRTA